jgi:hypothetical protein
MRKREAPKRTFTLDSIQVSTYRSRADFRTRLLFASRSRADFRTCLARCIQVSSRFSHLFGSLHPGLDSPPHFALSCSPGCIPGLDRTFALAQVSTLPTTTLRPRRSLARCPSRSREQRNEHVCTSAAAEHTRSVRGIDVNKQNSWWQKKLKKSREGGKKRRASKKEGSRKKKKKKR